MNLERNNVEIDVEFERREKIICNNCLIPLKNAALPKNPIVCISFPLVSDIIVRIYFSSESVTRYFFSCFCFVMWKWHLMISFLVSVPFIPH